MKLYKPKRFMKPNYAYAIFFLALVAILALIYFVLGMEINQFK